MRRSSVFFSDNKNLGLEDERLRRIVSVIRPLCDIQCMRVTSSLYRLTCHDEDAYARTEAIAKESALSEQTVRDCLLGALLSSIAERKNEKESEYRLNGVYMSLLPLLSMFNMR